VGIVAGVLLALAGVLLGVGGSLGRAFVVLGLFAPALLLQDLLRYAAFSSARPALAAANDAAWLTVTAAGFGVLAAVDGFTPSAALAAWAVGALAGAAVALRLLRTVPDVRATVRWLSAHRSISGWLVLSETMFAVGGQVIVVVVAAAVGTEGSAGIRSVMYLMQPVLLLSIAAQSIVLPAAVRRRDQGGDAASLQLLGRIALAMFAAFACYATAIWSVRTQTLGLVFGDDYRAFAPLVLPLALAFVLDSLSAVGHLAVVSLERARVVAMAQAVSTSIRVVVVCSLALLSGLESAAWGYVPASVASVVVFAANLRAARGPSGRSRPPATQRT
jgi:O-antigen/teichoic acid export membrane protein